MARIGEQGNVRRKALRKPFETAPSAFPAQILAPLWGATVPKQSRLAGPLQKHAKSRPIWAPAQQGKHRASRGHLPPSVFFVLLANFRRSHVFRRSYLFECWVFPSQFNMIIRRTTFESRGAAKYIWLCKTACAHICIYTYIYIYTHAHPHAHEHIYIYSYISVYV